MHEIGALNGDRGVVDGGDDAIEIVGDSFGQYFGELGIFELGVEAAEDALGGIDGAAAGSDADGADGRESAADGEANAAREIALEDQKRGEAGWVHVADIVLTIGLDGAATSQDGHP